MDALPQPVLIDILALVPVDTRLRCAEVSKAWRAALTAQSLWTRLDMSAASGVCGRIRSAAAMRGLLVAAVAHAGGGLQTVDVRDNPRLGVRQLVETLTGAHTRQLTDILMSGRVALSFLGELRALQRAAPRLRLLDANVECSLAGAPRVLREQPPAGTLRVRRLGVMGRASGEPEADVLALAAALEEAHDWHAESLELRHVPLSAPAVLTAVLDALLARRPPSLDLNCCGLRSAHSAQLARLLRGDSALVELRLAGRRHEYSLFDEVDVTSFTAALAANSTLTRLTLVDLGLEAPGSAKKDAQVGRDALLRALTGHASLRTLHITSSAVFANQLPASEVHGAARMALLLAANAPALRTLRFTQSALGDRQLTELCAGLAHNTHLETLDLSGNNPSAEFVRDVLLPAVRANTSLRVLHTGSTCAAAVEAEAIVAARCND